MFPEIIKTRKVKPGWEFAPLSGLVIKKSIAL